jgi:hypothetical protein
VSFSNDNTSAQDKSDSEHGRHTLTQNPLSHDIPLNKVIHGIYEVKANSEFWWSFLHLSDIFINLQFVYTTEIYQQNSHTCLSWHTLVDLAT